MATLQREKRVTYRELRHAFGLGDGLLEDIRKVLHFKQLAIEEAGEGLVWTGGQRPTPSTAAIPPNPPETVDTPTALSAAIPSRPPRVTPAATESNGPTMTPVSRAKGGEQASLPPNWVTMGVA